MSSTKEFLNAIKFSATKRVSGQNGWNVHSSRSHYIFQIRISGEDRARNQVKSILNIVDLAGSERKDGNLLNQDFNPNTKIERQQLDISKFRSNAPILTASKR